MSHQRQRYDFPSDMPPPTEEIVCVRRRDSDVWTWDTVERTGKKTAQNLARPPFFTTFAAAKPKTNAVPNGQESSCRARHNSKNGRLPRG